MIAGLKVCSLTCTSQRAAIIGDAIASALQLYVARLRFWKLALFRTGLVDGVCLLDLGMDEATRAAVHAVADPAGKPVHERAFVWQDDMGAARDAALAFAHECGYDVALIVDTDERIEARGQPLEDDLLLPGVRTWLARDLALGYTKPRFIRLPATGRYKSAAGCHELYPLVPEELAILNRLGFRELPKTPEQQAALNRYIVERMTKALRNPPDDNTRGTWLLLRASASRLFDPEAALADFRAALLNCNMMTAATAGWMAADTCLALGRPLDALKFCCRGMLRLPSLPELSWLAGVACMQLGQPIQAMGWARLAIIHGSFRGTSDLMPRTGHVGPPGFYEGPFLVLEGAYRAMGMEDEALAAKTDADAALAMREAA